ncbi:MAG: hypothetical protein A2275_12795 [Bacteroidetes bacterium RIFOXYA12_FULL_35_11]|nr:MAG: hypothetical protein A2X01_08325 [Bacteroidetes bacterium GWF2_35_48]OFY75525.1 MAG: hypothetical protein A2275_12795 [Bacteroidetes bacterium RIFOXYA12_FULL_35_11]OFY97499.1 MAG: hypothetical protein A2491_14175 [Bacteroidetes bacterium RIFOXYC12_FULL_35_7]HBX51246.1 hypothetical protein [Bacteroidales bacterium]
MPKVLRIINRFNLGGPTYNAAYLTKYLEPDFETLLVGGYKDETEEKSDFIVKSIGIEPVIIPEMRRSINIKNDLIAYKKLSGIIKDFKPDIVHTHASKAGFLGRYAAHKNNVPVIIHTFHGHVFHSYFKNYKSFIYKNIERYLARVSTKIIAISELQKEELAYKYKIAPPDKITVIPLGFDLNKFRENQDLKRRTFRDQYAIADDEIAIGIVGRLVPIKNHKLFIDSIVSVKKKSSKKIRAFIVGDGECRRELESYAVSQGLEISGNENLNSKSTLKFTSWIKNVDVVYSGLDIVTLTSLNEGTPVSLIEAQASSRPIVTTNAGGIENTVSHNLTALVSKNGNPQEFTNNLLRLVDDRELRESLSRMGWDFVANKFHFSRLADDMRSLYFELLAKKK